MKSFCELSEDGKRIEVYFHWNPVFVEGIKEINGRKFVPKDKGGPFWTVPKDIGTARHLRQVMGDGLELGDAVKAWANEERRTARNLASMAVSDDARLPVLSEKIPELEKWLRPYQKADAAMMARTSVLNANEPGLGKTAEVIAAVVESGLDQGPQLVVAPKTALESVWYDHVTKWLGCDVFILSGETQTWDESLEFIRELHGKKRPFWVVTTAAQVRAGLGIDITWNTFTIDEFHTTGLTNVSGDPSKGTQFGRAVRNVKRKRLFLVSGTPIGGKPIKIWGALHHLHSDKFTSKWRWADRWLDISDNGYGKVIGGIKRDMVDEFYPEHAQYIIRRLKSEVLPQLPPKQYIDVWCDMLPAQAKQYDQMEKKAEVRIEEERLSAVGVLAEYTRLKQFANAKCKIDYSSKGDPILIPQASGKLEYLIEKLDELGIRKDDPVGDAVSVVCSQSREYVDWLADQLNKKGIKSEKITGKVTGEMRTDIQRRFQSGKNSPRVIVMTTTAGGMSIDLDRADTIHIMDETWNPDNQSQAEDRLHRASRIHQVMCYYYRSRGTIEEAIKEVTEGKAVTQTNIMDIRRRMFIERDT